MPSSAIQFIPSDPPFFDFFATSRDTPEIAKLMRKAGAHRLPLSDAVLYTIGFRPRADSVSLSGALRTGNKLELGPKFTQRRHDSIIGQCCLVELGESVVLRPDFLGMLPLYHDEIDVSNRLHLMSLAKRCRRTYGVEVGSVGSMFVADNSFSMQLATFQTPISGVRILPAQHWLEVGKAVTVHSEVGNVPELDPDEYYRLIQQGADEISSNVAAAVNHFDIVEAPITAGRDSRITLAALVALGRVGDVRFSTHARDNDIPFGSALVKLFGGCYGIERQVAQWDVHSLEERVARRRTFYFGQYHLAKWGLFPQIFPIYSDRAVQLTGGLGEIYRAFYHKQAFAQPYLDLANNEATMRRIFGERHWVDAIPGHIDRIVKFLTETFDELPGSTLDGKFGAHYLNFRNRMHFGLTSLHRQPQTLIWNPLASPSLLRAALGLPTALKNAGRVIFDVTRELCPQLAYLPYGSPGPDYSKLPYHRASPLDGQNFSLDPAIDIVRGPTRKGAKQPKIPVQDMNAFVRRSILADFVELPNTQCSFLSGPSVSKRVHWTAIKGTERNADALYSKLDAIVHCLG